MKIGVCGFGHLAQITAVCLASLKHEVVQYDALPWLLREDQDVRNEPGWLKLAQSLMFLRTDRVSDLADRDVIWVAYDTPLLADGHGDDAAVIRRLHHFLPHFNDGQVVVLSSQWRVGTTFLLERAYPELDFVYVPENLRAGRAVQGFLRQDRIVVGVRRETHHSLLRALLEPLTDRLLWMTVESAELSKHALNALIAMQIAFINEIGVIADQVGATMPDVSRALRSDSRVSPSAPLTAGAPFSGGSLERDLRALEAFGAPALVSAIRLSNARAGKVAV